MWETVDEMVSQGTITAKIGEMIAIDIDALKSTVVETMMAIIHCGCGFNVL